MSNALLTPDEIALEILRVLHQKANFIGNVNRQYDDQFAKTGAKVGQTLRIKLPNRYTVRTGKTLSAQDTQEQSVSLTVATQKGVDMNFSSAELTMQMNDFSKQIIQPAISVLAANIEADFLQSVTKDVYNSVGTPGTTPSTVLVYGQAKQKLTENLAPDEDRKLMISSATQAATVSGFSTLFNASKEISDQYKKGAMGNALGFDWYENNSILTLTTGSRTNVTPLVNGNQTGSSLVIKGAGNGVTMKQGDIFTIAGVYTVHPETKQQYPNLQQFVVTADAQATAGGDVTVSISPSIVTTGALQNVSAQAADGQAITWLGSASTAYGQNLAFHQDAFAFVTADLEMPQGVHFASRQTIDGITVRIVRAYDINNDNIPCRIDVLYGYKTLRAQLACRVTQ